MGVYDRARLPMKIQTCAFACGPPLAFLRNDSCAICPPSSFRKSCWRVRGLRFPGGLRISTQYAVSLSANGSSPDEERDVAGESTGQSSEEEEIFAEIERLSPKELKWADIPFENIQEELDAIDEYVREEGVPPQDPWPKFLRGAAYEHWGQPKLAIAQYALTEEAGGLRIVPEIWERTAYNNFKLGDVKAANNNLDIAQVLHNEATGNQLHFMTWFYEHFTIHLPKRNGPPFNTQRAIVKYCVGSLTRAREGFAARLTMREEDCYHSVLWFLAVSYRLSPGGIPSNDARLANSVLDSEMECPDILKQFANLFTLATTFKVDDRDAAYENLVQVVEELDKTLVDPDITSHLYLALYHDAFTRDTYERDRQLDLATATQQTMCPNDMENYLFYVGKNRLSNPEVKLAA